MIRILRRCSHSRLKPLVRHNSVRAATSAQPQLDSILQTLRSQDILHTTQPVQMDDTWKSSNESLFQETFSKELHQYTSLLEAFLAKSDFERAENVLVSIYLICRETDNMRGFRQHLNDFLKVFALSSKSSLENVEKWVEQIPMKFQGIEPDHRAFGVLLRKAIDRGKDYGPYLTLASTNGIPLKRLLGQVDVLGLANLHKLVNEQNIDIANLPKRYQEIFSLGASFSGSTPFSDSKPVEKDSSELKAIDSFNLKVVRHSLSGLQDSNEKFVNLLKQNLAEVDSGVVEEFSNVASDKPLDFHSLLSSLESAEAKEVFNKALDAFNVDRQRSMELMAVDSAREKWKHEFESLSGSNAAPLSKHIKHKLWVWTKEMVPLIKDEISRCESEINPDHKPTHAKHSPVANKSKSASRDRREYGPYLQLITPDKMAAITILETLKTSSNQNSPMAKEGSSSARTLRLVLAVGKAVELEFRAQQLLKSEVDVFKKFQSIKKSTEFKKLVVQRKFENLLRQAKSDFVGEQISENFVNWPHETKIRVGSALLSILMHVAKINVKGKDPRTGEEVVGEVPAFHHQYHYMAGQKVGMIQTHPELEKQLGSGNLEGALHPQFLPMLVEPRPWTSYKTGGYYFSENKVLRTKESPEQDAYVKAACENGDLSRIYEGLNVLGSTPWTINKQMFEVLCRVWNTGEEFLDIPPQVSQFEYPEAPPRNAEPQVRAAWKLKVKELGNEYGKHRSLRCDGNYKLEIARSYLGEKMFFPHSLDFRGRAYPIPPLFNHLGNDMSRSLLLFWEGKKLEENGWKWLKVHFANLYGFDKASLDDRVTFTETSKEKILECASDPFQCKWWMEADKPWQTLATCFELSKAWSMENPHDYVSCMPVHQDGTCNGLQHYAALGGDVEGAHQVNLVPSDKPADIYTHVAKLVKEKVDLDIARGNEHAILCQDVIKRKVVKQTVMTNVYGVTFIGANQQIEKQLPVSLGEERSNVAKYLTRLVFDSIRQLFEGAHLIQDWLAESAGYITKSIRPDLAEFTPKNGERPEFLSSVIWTTPLGLPIVQPYRTIKRKQITTNLQTVFIADPFAVSPVDSKKQKSAFPPNYIHSLDASHMLLSAIQCGELGLSFAAVHDSYWTHPCDVDKMNSVIREQFIALHEVDLVAQLKNEFDRRYKGFYSIIEIPKASEEAVRVRQMRKELTSKLGRKITLVDEVFLENERRALLESDEEEKRSIADSISTPISILENVQIDGSREAGKQKVLAPFKLQDIPPKGDFDVQMVRESRYFFS